MLLFAQFFHWTSVPCLLKIHTFGNVEKQCGLKQTNITCSTHRNIETIKVRDTTSMKLRPGIGVRKTIVSCLCLYATIVQALINSRLFYSPYLKHRSEKEHQGNSPTSRFYQNTFLLFLDQFFDFSLKKRPIK